MKTIEQKIQKVAQLYNRQLITESELVAEFVDQIVDNRACEKSKSLQQLLPRSAISALYDLLANLKDSGFLRKRVLIDSSLMQRNNRRGRNRYATNINGSVLHLKSEVLGRKIPGTGHGNEIGGRSTSLWRIGCGGPTTLDSWTGRGSHPPPRGGKYGESWALGAETC